MQWADSLVTGDGYFNLSTGVPMGIHKGLPGGLCRYVWVNKTHNQRWESNPRPPFQIDAKSHFLICPKDAFLICAKRPPTNVHPPPPPPPFPKPPPHKSWSSHITALACAKKSTDELLPYHQQEKGTMVRKLIKRMHLCYCKKEDTDHY